jgi:hypothetical protein
VWGEGRRESFHSGDIPNQGGCREAYYQVQKTGEISRNKATPHELENISWGIKQQNKVSEYFSLFQAVAVKKGMYTP